MGQAAKQPPIRGFPHPSELQAAAPAISSFCHLLPLPFGVGVASGFRNDFHSVLAGVVLLGSPSHSWTTRSGTFSQGAARG